MLNSGLIVTDRIPSKEGEDEKRQEKDKTQKEDQKCSEKHSSSSGKNLRYSETIGSPEMEKGSTESQKNLEVKSRLVVTRLTSEEHRASQG